MAALNPTPAPVDAPIYTSFMYGARSAPEPMVDKSAAISGEASGKALENTVKALDTGVKTFLDQDIGGHVDQIRDQYTTALNTYKANTSGMSDPEMKGAADMKLIDPAADPQQVPKSIQMGLQNAQSTVAGYQAGKVSPTYYYQQLTSMAKDLRTTFPGYRDYIDQKMHEMTGVTPANAYLRSIIQDIDRSSEGKNAQSKEIFNGLFSLGKEGFPGAGVVWKNYSEGAYGTPGSTDAVSHVMNIVSGMNKDLWAAKDAEAKLKEKASNKESTALDLEPGANQWANNLVSNAMHTEMTHGGKVSPDQLTQLVKDQLAGRVNIPDQVWVQRGMELKSYTDQLRGELIQHYTEHEDGKQSIQDIIGQDKVNKIIDNALKPLQDQSDFYLKGDYRMALFHQQMNTAMKNDDQYQLLNDPFWGQPVRKAMVMRDKFGPLSAQFELDQLLNKQGMQKFKDLKLNAIQPENFPEGKVSASNSIKAIVSQLPKDPQGNPVGAPENINDYMSIFKYLDNPQTPAAAKEALAKTIYGTGNEDFLTNFKGAPSRLKMYTDALNPTRIDTIRKLGDPNLWEQMRTFAEQQYAHFLFPEEIANLRSITNDPNHQPIKISYTSDNGIPKWKVIPSANKGPINPMALVGPTSTAQNTYEVQVQKILDRLNMGMIPLAKIAQTEKSDVDAYVLGLFHNANIDLTSTNLAGIPEQMLNALNTAKNAGRMYRQQPGDKSQARVTPQ